MNDKAVSTGNASTGNASTGNASTRGGSTREPGDTAYIVPRVDVIEDSAGITLLADLPGVAKDALELKVEGTSLTLEGQIKLDTPQAMGAVFAEVRAARYRRAFTLSRELDSAAIDAQLKDGVLKLRIPKLAEAQPRRIEVRAA